MLFVHSIGTHMPGASFGLVTQALGGGNANQHGLLLYQVFKGVAGLFVPRLGWPRRSPSAPV
jgi:hypothetical protein